MKKLPAMLVVGFVLEACCDLARIGVEWKEAYNGTWDLVENGAITAGTVMIALGLLDLARGLTGARALGARIAAWAQLVQLALTVGWLALSLYSQVHHGQWGAGLKLFDESMHYVMSLSMVAIGVGLLLATENLVLGIATIAIAVIGVPIPPIESALEHALPHSRIVMAAFHLLPYFLLNALWLTALLLGRFQPPPVLASARDAFTSASKALWLRLVAAASLAVLMLFAALSRSQDIMSLIKAVTLLSPAVDAIALAMFATAVLRLSRAQIAPWWTSIAGAAAWFSAGALLAKLPTMYVAMYEERYGESQYERVAQLDAGTLIIPLVATAAIVLVLMTVSRLARERNAEDIRENVNVRTGVYVVLALGVLFVVTYGYPRLPPSEGAIMFTLLAVAAASMYAASLAAKLCAQGAEILDRDLAGFPAARIVS